MPFFFRDRIAPLITPSALLIVLSLLWTLVVAPLAHHGSVSRSRTATFAGLLALATADTPEARKCCCPGAKRGRCCCGLEGNGAHALRFCAVCDAHPDAIVRDSALPPVILSRAALLKAADFATVLFVAFPATDIAAEKHTGFPPDAPPRFLGATTTSLCAAIRSRAA